jgi:SMC interacting uncharacterized protein involved in chromosome segregation
MFNEEEIKDMEEAIATMEDDLSQAKADLKKKKYGALREAIEARNEMDKVVQEELTKLNLQHNPWTVQPSRHLFWR